MSRAVLQALAILTITAAPAHAENLNGATLSLPWGIPFAALLLTIATGPLLFPKIWHDHYGKIGALWAAIALAPIFFVHGASTALAVLTHALLGEYLSFIVLLFALYSVAGGILVTGRINGTPASNTCMLGIGTVLASFVGTTGAAMILIRPVLRANEGRRHHVHVVVFFIILVANVGGALTPLGDPPLFLGFLHGVDFFWPLQNLWLQTFIVAATLLVLFFVLDSLLYRREQQSPSSAVAQAGRIQVHGLANLLLMALIIGAVLLSAVWKPGHISVLGTQIEFQDIARDILLLAIGLLSLWLTPDEHRAANGFVWGPFLEVAKLFAAIFIAIAPVVAMLQAGRNGPFVALLSAVAGDDGRPNEAAYFWLTGILSAFLDNAPTYLVFFEVGGGDAAQLKGPLAGTLAAISMGSVYMGALTYIGNAPNLMIYAIAKERGIKMPSFFGYSLYASIILIPLLLLLTFLPVPPLLKLG